MSASPACPQCQSPYTYEDGNLWICPECSFEWNSQDLASQAEAPAEQGTRDANGTPLVTGDSVIVIKELKIKGASSAVKVGTKVKNIRILDNASDGHDISCKIDGLGSIYLKSEFVRKA